MGQKKKIAKYIFPAIGLLVVLLPILNLYLSNRLERYLKKELSRRTAEATDGFYTLSFEDLSIGFVKGELKIEGVRLMPDTAVFRQRSAIDSFPQTYVKAQIGVINFEGVNLIWRWSYKKLHFNSFKITNPEIEIFDSYNSARTESKVKNVSSKSLYEIISPYINVLSVRTLNLENASVSYTVENPDTPIIYALTDVSFHAYGFMLDENSSQSGKLLYCDGFEFVTHQPQTLLTNTDFVLKTDSIKLSTQDSVIYIKKINLIPQEKLWTAKNQKPDRYVDALIKTVEVNGIEFKREKALNYLTARSFTISSSDIHLFNQTGKTSSKDSRTNGSMKINADSLIQALSLYDIISPVLHRVAIQSIAIKEAKAAYYQCINDSVEVYKLNNIDFHADEFLIDSASEVKHGLWYSRSFAFEATGISGMMTARNHRFDVERMALNTETGDFSIENIHLKPISAKSCNHYVSGSIDTIAIKGLVYNKGISDDLFLSIKKIRLNQASVTLSDKSVSKPIVYKLKKCDICKIVWDIHHFAVGDILLTDPVFSYPLGTIFGEEKKKPAPNGLNDIKDIYGILERFTPDLSLGKLDITNVVLNNDTASLLLEGLHINVVNRLFKLNTIRFNTKNISFPLDRGFYTLNIGEINLNNTQLDLANIHLFSQYPKMEFAYLQPEHKDWFDVRVGRLGLAGMDLSAWIAEKVVKIRKVELDDAVLQNFKNQQIVVPRRIVPMIYSGLQKAPVKMAIDSLNVTDFSVVYEELARKGKEPGKLFFTDLNGKFTGFTNIVTRPEQYIHLDADGKLMGEGYFTATWLLPVDSLNDRFLLKAHLTDLNLTALNELITPLASARVKSGRLDDLTFSMAASSKEAKVDMLFLYRDLEAEIFKEKHGEVIDDKFLSRLTNLVLKHDNPDHPEKGGHKPRESHLTVERNPYHSTFNYLWQILRPPLIESVGVSKKTQGVAEEASDFLTKMKNLFHPKKNKARTEKEIEQKE